MLTTKKEIIGGREKVLLPEISSKKIVARIDTGARSSSVHCEKYWIEIKRKKKVLHAAILSKSNLFTFTDYKIKKVKSSNGISETRYVVRLKVTIGQHELESDFTLTTRKKMKNPVLLGRRILRGHFLVDVSRNFVLSGNATVPKKIFSKR